VKTCTSAMPLFCIGPRCQARAAAAKVVDIHEVTPLDYFGVLGWLVAAVLLLLLLASRRTAQPPSARKQASARQSSARNYRFQAPTAPTTTARFPGETPWWLKCLPQAQPRNRPPAQQRQQPSQSAVDAETSTGPVYLYPPVITPFMHVTLESRPTHAFPVLRMRTTGEGYGSPEQAAADFSRCIQFCIGLLERRERFLVLYDFRVSRWPPVALCTQGVREADAHAKAWDTCAQGIACVIDSMIARSFLQMLLKVLQPPQPVTFCSSPDEGLAFLGNIREAQVFEALSKRPERDEASG